MQLTKNSEMGTVSCNMESGALSLSRGDYESSTRKSSFSPELDKEFAPDLLFIALFLPIKSLATTGLVP